MSATQAELLASAQILVKVCQDPNYAFLKCRKNDENPSACLKEGAAVKVCTENLIARLQQSVGKPFAAFGACLDKTNNAFDKCAKEKAALQTAWAAVKQ